MEIIIKVDSDRIVEVGYISDGFAAGVPSGNVATFFCMRREEETS